MPDSSPPSRPPAFRVGSLRGFLPLNEAPALGRHQTLSNLIQNRSSGNLRDLRERVASRRSLLADDEDDEAGGELERSRSIDWESDEPSATKNSQGRRGSVLSKEEEILNTPQMRSMRLIGQNNPRYRWEQYYKSPEELKRYKKPIREYYERNNHLITSYGYIDRLLDSSLPHSLIQEYQSAAHNSTHNQNPNIPSTIPEDPSSPGTHESQSPVDGECIPGNGTASKVKVKRTPRALYRVPDEETPLLDGDPPSGPKTFELASGGEGEETDSSSAVVTVAIYVNLAANAILLAGKIAVIVLTSSLSVLASLVDAALDFLSTAIVWTTTRLISHNDNYSYPVGRRKLEPLGVLVFSVIMITAFFQVFLECINRLTSGDHSIVQLGLPAIIIMASTVFLKLGCWFWCRLIKNSSVQALAQDAMTDVIFNIFSIIFPLVGYYAHLWWLDALGGVLLSLYVIINWSQTTTLHIKHLTGAAAPADDRNVLLYLTMRFAKTIRSIQGCQAYHAGDKLNVEVDIVLDEGMTLRDSHDLGESLQYVLESVPSVDRAFVHLDYADYNLPSHMHQQAED